MRIFLLWIIVLTSAQSVAQSLIKGQVVNQNQEAIPGVTIAIKDSSIGAITDVQGYFQIKADPSDIFLVRAIGYYQRELDRAEIDGGLIVLIDRISELDQVVVTALGLERQQRDLGYPIQGLKSDQLSTVAPNFIDNLAGKLAGVTISQGATGVGSTSKITIRGESSFTSNNPLFIVDGTPINNNTIVNFTNDAAAGIQEVDFGNGGMEINSDDIESLSVLKGPGAAALYGTRASNGVIIVTTKDGSQAKGIGVSFNSTISIERAFKLPDFQNEYGQGNAGGFAFVDGNGAGTNDFLSYSWGPSFASAGLIPQFNSPIALPDGTSIRGGDLALYNDLSITPTAFEAYPDNLKDFYETGITTINNLSIGTSFSNGSYRFSVSDLNSESIIPGVNLQRRNVSTRINFKPTDRLSIVTSINYVNSQSDNRPSSGYGSENVNYSLVAWGPRSLDINALKNYWQPGLEGREQFSFNYAFFDNPYFILNENRNSFNRDRLFGNMAVTYDLSPALTLSLRTGMDYSDELRQYRRSFSTNRFGQGAYAEQAVFFRENNSDLLFNYQKTVSYFSINITAGANRMDQQFSNSQSQVFGLAVPQVYNLSNGASPIETSQNIFRKRINSAYGLLKVGFRDWIFLEVTGRNDWSSALPEQSFFYPSVSSSYVLSNFLQLPRQISFAQLRASWAQVGNDTDPYQTASTFVPSVAVQSLPTFTDASTIANRDLVPEQTRAVEFGADFRFFNERLRLDATYYNAITENQIISLPVSITSGYQQQVLNGGKVRSQGVELVLGATPIYNNGFQWNTTLNFSRNVTRVESLPSGDDRLTLAYSSIYDNPNQAVYFQVEEGGLVGDIYGTGYLKNEEGQFIIDEDGRYTVDNTLQKLGNYNPDFILGIGNSLSYQNWNVDFLFDWRYGGIIVSRTQALAGVGGQLIETAYRPDEGIVAEGVVNVGTEGNPVYEPNTTAVSAESYYRQFYDRNHEENNTLNASYLKLRQLTLSYIFSDFAQNILNSDASLSISLIGRNLFAISDIRHFDPEQLAVQGANFISGVEDMSYATTRSIGLKLGLNF